MRKISLLLLVFCVEILVIFVFCSNVYALSASIESITPGEILNKSDVVEVKISIIDSTYLRASFQEKDGRPYFGEMKNNKEDWVKVEPLNSDNCDQYYEIGQTENGVVVINLRIGDENVVNSDEYRIKVHKFVKSENGNCSYDLLTNSDAFKILLPTPTPTPSPAPTVSPSPTPTPSSTPTPTPETHNYDNIKITEMYPAPLSKDDDTKEWVELYNGNDHEVALESWYLEDAKGNTRKFDSFTIAGKTYAYFSFASGFLNNDTDSLKLLNASKEEKASAPLYSDVPQGYSWSLVDDSWCVTNPSKGSSNLSCVDLAEDDKEEAEEDEDGTVLGKKTSRPTESAKSEEMLTSSNSADRKLPGVATLSAQATENTEATVAGVVAKGGKPSLVMPLGIAGAGLGLLGGGTYPFWQPKVKELVKPMLSKKKSPSSTTEYKI